MFKHFSGRGWLVLGVALLAVFVLSVAAASAQSVASSVIQGTVKDDTGGALPGVTVTLTSPALQVGQRVAVTQADGSYRIGELPGGTYRLAFELTGFRTFIREGLRLTISFTARVDATMGVGGLEESVTVSGQSPVVDLTSTGTAANFTEELLTAIPRGRDLQSVVDMAPGVTRDGAPDVGGSRMASRPDMSTYGVEATPKIQVEGINITTGSDPNTGVYFNYFGMEEIQVKTSGTSAEVGTAGLHMIGVLKSGGNQFHGQYETSYQGPQTQSSNLTPELEAQGLSDTEPLEHHYDVAADLGGRIIRDKLWFYGGISRQERKSSLLGFVSGPGPDGQYLTGDEPLGLYTNALTNINTKVSWQMSQNNRLIGVYQNGLKTQPQNGATRFRPLEATRDYVDRTGLKKVELQSTITPRMLVNVVGGYGGYFADYQAERGPNYPGPAFPSRLDRETGVRTGGHESSDQRPRDNWQIDGSVSFFPERSMGGQHEFKTGGTWYRYLHGTGKLNHSHGNYYLIYDRVGGLSGQPAEIQFANYPTAPRNRVNVHAWYVTDAWRLSDRVSANLGLRIERQDAFVPPQSKEASPQFPQLFPAGQFSRVDVVTWTRALPRLGLAWEVSNNTVVKTSFGLYNDLYRDADVGNFNGNADVTTRYRWRDLDGNNNYTPGEVDLNPSGPDFITISGSRNRILNPDLKQPMTKEATASIEREVAANLGVRVGYVFRTRNNLYDFAGINVLRPREAYNIPLSRRDPGPDGLVGSADDGGMVTIYDYDPAFRGSAFVGEQQVNSDTTDRFHTIEAAVSKRLTGRWMAQFSTWALKNHRWIERDFDTPNDDPFPLDETWSWGMNLTGLYQLPGGFNVSGFLSSKTGVKGARTYVFRAADPSGGPSLRQLSTVTLRLEPYGSQTTPAINVMHLRGSKEFRLGDQRLGFDVDLFNLFNTSVPTAMGFDSGPTFRYADGVMASRIVRFGARFSF